MVRLTGEGASKALQRLAREQIKTKLLVDINKDMIICKLEGRDQLEYIRELQDLLNSFTKKDLTNDIEFSIL